MALMDDLASPGARFEITRKGYNRFQVDDHLARIEAELRLLTADRDAAVSHMNDLRERVKNLDALEVDRDAAVSHANDLRERVKNLDAQVRLLSLSPTTLEGLGARLQNMLQLAQIEANEVKERAEAEAAEIRGQSKAEAERRIREAAEEANRTLEEKTAEANRRLHGAANEANRRVAEATEEAMRRVSYASERVRELRRLRQRITGHMQTLRSEFATTQLALDSVHTAFAEARPLLEEGEDEQEILIKPPLPATQRPLALS